MRSKRRVRERRLLRPHWWLVLSSWGLGGSKLRGNRVPSYCGPTTCSRCPKGSILCGSEAKWTVLWICALVSGDALHKCWSVMVKITQNVNGVVSL